MVNTPVPDSITTINNRTIYWFSLPTYYNMTVVGTYPITITTYSPNLDGCGTEQDIDFELISIIILCGLLNFIHGIFYVQVEVAVLWQE